MSRDPILGMRNSPLDAVLIETTLFPCFMTWLLMVLDIRLYNCHHTFPRKSLLPCSVTVSHCWLLLLVSLKWNVSLVKVRLLAESTPLKVSQKNVQSFIVLGLLSMFCSTRRELKGFGDVEWANYFICYNFCYMEMNINHHWGKIGLFSEIASQRNICSFNYVY